MVGEAGGAAGATGLWVAADQEGGNVQTLSGPGFTLTAVPGREYIQVNGRCLYVPGGVQCRQGHTVLSLALLSNALGCPLTWNAATGTADLDTASARPPQANYNSEDLYWLSRIICAESGAESMTGQIAVGNVILNRVRSGSFPNTVEGVIFDRKDAVQFEPVSNGRVYLPPTSQSVEAAKRALDGENVVGSALYFYAPALSQGTWINANRPYQQTIGCHRFYR